MIDPEGLALDPSGNLYIADGLNDNVREVTAGGIISTFAGQLPAGFYGDGGLAVSAGLSGPQSVALDAAGNVYISDLHNSRVRKVSPSGIISTFAGSGPTACFSTPCGTISGVGGLATNAVLGYPIVQVAVDRSGNVFIADTSANEIQKVDLNGIITTVAGNGEGSPFPGGFSGDNGPATAAELNYPDGVAVDAEGNIYIADSGNGRVRKVSQNGIITTIAGNGTAGFSGDDGPAVLAEFSAYGPTSIAIDAAGNLFVTDPGNNRVRKISTDGTITTVAGSGPSCARLFCQGFSGDGGPATSAVLSGPSGVAVDASGNLYIADSGNSRVREVFAVDPPATPVLNVSPGAELFTLAQSSSPASGSVTIRNIGSGTLNYTATAAADQGNWLSLTSNATGSVNAGGAGSLSFSVSPAQLAAGTYPGQIVVTDTASGKQDRAVITLVISAAAPSLALSQSAVTLTAIAGGAQPLAQSFAVGNSGGGSVGWTAQAQTVLNGTWLSVSPSSGTSIGGQPGTPVAISANTIGLNPGQYYGSVNILAPGAVNSPQTVSVLLNIVAAPESGPVGITASSGGVVLLGAAGDMSTAARQVTLFNPSASAITFTATSSPANSWLTVSPAAGTLNSGGNTFTVEASFAALSAGLDTGSINLAFSDGTTSTLEVLAIATQLPSSSSNLRRNAVTAGCSGGQASSLAAVFDQPFSKATFESGVSASLQVELYDDCGNPVTAAAGGTAQVAFSNGDPPVTLNDTGLGIWQGTWDPATSAAQVTLQLSAAESGLTLNSSVPSSVTVATQPPASGTAVAARPIGIVNAAAGGQGAPGVVSPGSYVAIYGSNLTMTAAVTATTIPLPLTLGGTQLLLGGQPLPISYAGPNQINALIPQNLNSNVSYPLVITSGSTESAPTLLAVKFQ